MRIDVLANDGSPLGVSEASINGDDGRMGVGGAELAILTLMAGWADAGHDVTFYNDPQHNHRSRFRHAPMSLFTPRESRDILIIFRSPNRRAENANGRKIWFSTDQYTVGGFAEFAKKVDKIVTISPFHAEYFRDTYQIENTTTIDLPVRTWEYNKIIPKVPHRMIFCSVPDRGLAVLADGYDYIKQHVPDASLVITSDYRLWGASSPMNEKYLRRFMGKPDVVFLGAVGRPKMIEEQLMADIHAYPSTYPELFCYAVAESQVAGAYPITSTMGALSTTNMGSLLAGDPTAKQWKDDFCNAVITSMKKRNETREMADEIRHQAIERFSLSRILTEWDEKVFHG